MRSVLRAMGSLVGDVVDFPVWMYVLPFAIAGAIVAIVVVDDPLLAVGVVSAVGMLVCIPIVTAYVGTVRARDRYERALREEREHADLG